MSRRTSVKIAGSVPGRLGERLATHPVQVELPPDLPLLRVDAILLEQVLGNLLENAAKHTPPGTPVALRAERRGEELVVSVEDAGPGLPPGDPERLFAKFQRGHSESAVGGVGHFANGLGLPEPGPSQYMTFALPAGAGAAGQ